MSVTIYHNPNCSTSRKVLGWLKEKGAEPKVVEYLKTPLDEAGIKALLRKMKVGPRDILRRKGDEFEALKLTDKTTDEALIKAMAKTPILIERPIVVGPKGAVLCRPPERVWEAV
ncbi:MAG TPA: arsenate reductase (glutaredoxin) [Dongiaceae bacterium]|jgi:arsenate reductase|nr:arsenate reductase (glutaredoxin) [Dongiaceae bacterium]